MQFGWEDERHVWEFIGNFTVHDFIHKINWPFSLWRCERCDAHKTGSVENDHGGYITPLCKEVESELNLIN